MKRMRAVVGAAAVLTVLATGGWISWRLSQQLQARDAELAEARGRLEQTQRQLSDAQAAQASSAASYDALRREQDDAADAVRRLNASHSILSEQVRALEEEKVALGQGWQEAASQQDALQQQLGALRDDVAAASSEAQQVRRLVEEQARALEDAHATRQLSAQEVERLAQQLSRQQADAHWYEERLVELSSAYDQLFAAQWKPPRAAQAAASRASARTAATPPALSRRDAARQARLSRDLGQAYWLLRRYPEAAQALEESLRYRESPELHAQLTVLYSRFLQDPRKASEHLAKSRGARLLATVPFAEPAHLPRSSTALLYDHLTE